MSSVFPAVRDPLIGVSNAGAWIPWDQYSQTTFTPGGVDAQPQKLIGANTGTNSLYSLAQQYGFDTGPNSWTNQFLKDNPSAGQASQTLDPVDISTPRQAAAAAYLQQMGLTPKIAEQGSNVFTGLFDQGGNLVNYGKNDLGDMARSDLRGVASVLAMAGGAYGFGLGGAGAGAGAAGGGGTGMADWFAAGSGGMGGVGAGAAGTTGAGSMAGFDLSSMFSGGSSWLNPSTLSAGMNLAGGLFGANAAKEAAQIQADASRYAADQNAAMMAPYTDAAKAIMPKLTAAAQDIKPFTLADALTSPAEQYAQQQAMQATENSAAARGGLLGGNTQQALQTNAANIASQFENQAFNQYWGNIQNQLAPMESVARLTANPMQSVAETNANAILAGAGAQAGGVVGSANAWGNALSNTGNQAMQMYYMNQLFGNRAANNPATYMNLGGSLSPNSLYQYGADLSGALESDIRLKTDIEQIGVRPDGLKVYKFRYKKGGPEQVGLMAQEVMAVYPLAVSVNDAGYLMVDYSKV